jgi:hypothetical protein
MLRHLLPLSFGLTVVLALGACGDVSLLDNLPPPPTITAFTATPSALDAGGGATLLAWTVVNQDTLVLQPGSADVTGYTSANEMPTVTTTYTLWAYNSLGGVSSSVTVTVGP